MASMLAWLALEGRGVAASSSTVVGATVPSATAIDASGCAPGVSGRTDLGIVLPGSLASSSSDCTVTYGSSNDSVMLRMFQTDDSGSAFWRPGDQLDTTFDGDGVRTHDLEPADDDQALGVALLADGSAVVTGARRSPGANDDMYVAKYLPNGSLDGSFGTAGFAVLPDLSALGEGGGKVVVASDGSIFVGGQLGPADHALVKLTPAGVLDTTFNGTGYWTLDPGSFDSVNDIAVDQQGRVVAVASSLGGDSVIYRLTSAGLLDSSWAGDGSYELPVSDWCSDAVTIDDAGRVLCAGARDNAGDEDAIVHRFSPSGVLDASFGTAGTYELTDFGGVDDGFEMVETHPDGGLVLAGGTAAFLPFTVRLDDDGDPMPTWDGDGVRTYALAGWSGAIVGRGTVLSNGNVVLGALALDPSPVPNIDAAVLMVDGITGALLPWYGTNGAVSFDLTANDDWTYAQDMAVGADGRIAVVGRILSTDDDSFVLHLEPIAATDFDAGVADWDTGTQSVFGACLRSTTVGAAAAPWTVDPGADCGQTDADAWRPIASSVGSPGSKLASRSAIGGPDVSVALNFGLRVASSQRPGAYLAPIIFDVVAPDA